MDPLAQLKDIHLPQQVHNYPLAIGWWLLAIISLVLLVWGIVKIKRYRSQRNNKNIALKQLKTMELTNHQIISLLKWCCLQYFPRTSSASLYGDDFKTFLINALPNKKREDFKQLSKNIFTDVYRLDPENNDNEQLSQAAKHWLKYALPLRNIELLAETFESDTQGDKKIKEQEQKQGEPA